MRYLDIVAKILERRDVNAFLREMTNVTGRWYSFVINDRFFIFLSLSLCLSASIVSTLFDVAGIVNVCVCCADVTILFFYLIFQMFTRYEIK